LPQSSRSFDWFTRDEIKRVFKALSANDIGDSIILIGGQSIAFWAQYYRISIPQTESPALTQDLDFLGKAAAAKALGNAINAKVKIATFDDSTPNTGLLTWAPSQSSDRRLLIDFLRNVLGVLDKDVKNLAVTVAIEDLPAIKVLHPIICMQSRFANLATLSSKRDKNGIIQAKLSVEIAKQFIANDAMPLGNTVVSRAISRIMAICTAPSAIYVLHEFGIDGRDAIDLSLLPKDHPFVTIEYPKLLYKYEKKVAIALRSRQSINKDK
jgi:hypothetical protein